MEKVTAVVDLQFGSTGKGLIAGHLAANVIKPDVVVTAWAPNAGHTYIDQYGNKMIHTMLANGCVSPNLKFILIGPGSVLNIENLKLEIDQAYAMGYLRGVAILVHPHAPIVQEKHREAERQGIDKIGSTQKGSGVALIEKIMRNPDEKVVAKDLFLSRDGHIHTAGAKAEGACVCAVTTVDDYNFYLDKAERVLVEGAQGFSLGINNGFYPYTTSRECTINQLLNDCAIPPQMLKKTIGVARTFPIRVSNRFDNDGNLVTSGPCYPDQKEISFEDIGQPVELTTVTQLPRRIFTFSNAQIAQAIRMNGVDEIFLNFANYMCERGTDVKFGEDAIPDGKQLLSNIIDHIGTCGEAQGLATRVAYLGWGPAVEDIEEC